MFTSLLFSDKFNIILIRTYSRQNCISYKTYQCKFILYEHNLQETGMILKHRGQYCIVFYKISFYITQIFWELKSFLLSVLVMMQLYWSLMWGKISRTKAFSSPAEANMRIQQDCFSPDAFQMVSVSVLCDWTDKPEPNQGIRAKNQNHDYKSFITELTQ